MSLGVRIRKARIKAGISQARLAELLGVTRSACSQWEAPHGTAPRQERLLQLAELLGVSYGWLATGHDSGDPGAVRERAGAYRAPLRTDEHELLRLFDRLNRKGRRALLELLRSL